MGADGYLQQVLFRSRAQTGILGPGERVRSGLYGIISAWATAQLLELKLSGSYAKNTAIRGGTDVDLFVSLRSNTTNTLKEIYESLATHLTNHGYAVRRQNVSVGITYQGLSVDITPGKRQGDYNTDHSVYVRRLDTWKQTNVDTHVWEVGGSGYTDAIVLMKRWRQCHGIELPSFALELATLRALRATRSAGLSNQLWTVFQFLRDNIATCQLIDPANTNNNVASELTLAEKQTIAATARRSFAAANWGDIVW